MLALDSVLRSLDRSRTALLLDGWVSPLKSATALGEKTAVVLRMIERREGPTEELSDLAGGAKFGPWPAKQWFAAIDGDALKAVPASGGDSEPWRVKRVAVTASERAWRESPPSPWTAEIELHIEGDRVVVAGLGAGEDEAAARGRVSELASALGRALGVAVDGATESSTGSVEPALATVGDGARLAWTLEGDLLVLRDLASVGPAASASRYRLAALVLGGLAAALSVALAVQIPGGGVGALLGTGSVALVLAIAAYAFFEIGRFAGRFSSDDMPLAWFGSDRVVVAPWVSRYGAVDTRPQGRFGAAIRTSEINGCAALSKHGETAVELATEHGPIEVVRVADASLGASIVTVVERAVRMVAAPEKKKTALQRAKARREERAVPAPSVEAPAKEL